MNGCVDGVVCLCVRSKSPSRTDSGEHLLLGVFDVRLICILKASDRRGEEEGVGRYSDRQRLCFRGSR